MPRPSPSLMNNGGKNTLSSSSSSSVSYTLQKPPVVAATATSRLPRKPPVPTTATLAAAAAAAAKTRIALSAKSVNISHPVPLTSASAAAKTTATVEPEKQILLSSFEQQADVRTSSIAESALMEFAAFGNTILREQQLLLDVFRGMRAIFIDHSRESRFSSHLSNYLDAIVDSQSSPSSSSSFSSSSSPSFSHNRNVRLSLSLPGTLAFIEMLVNRSGGGAGDDPFHNNNNNSNNNNNNNNNKLALLSRWVSLHRLCSVTRSPSSPLLAACLSKQMMRSDIAGDETIVSVLYFNNGASSASPFMRLPSSSAGATAATSHHQQKRPSLARLSLSSSSPSSPSSSFPLSASTTTALQWHSDICSRFCRPATEQHNIANPLLKAARHFSGRLFARGFAREAEQLVVARRLRARAKEKKTNVVESTIDGDCHGDDDDDDGHDDLMFQQRTRSRTSPDPRNPIGNVTGNDPSKSDDSESEESDTEMPNQEQQQNESDADNNNTNNLAAETISKPWCIAIAEAGSKELLTTIQQQLGYTLVGDVVAPNQIPKSRRNVALLVRNDKLECIVPGSIRDGTEEQVPQGNDNNDSGCNRRDDENRNEDEQKRNAKLAQIFCARWTSLDFCIGRERGNHNDDDDDDDDSSQNNKKSNNNNVVNIVRIIALHLHHRGAPKTKHDYPVLRRLATMMTASDGDESSSGMQTTTTNKTTIVIGDFNRPVTSLFPSSSSSSGDNIRHLRVLFPSSQIDNCVIASNSCSGPSRAPTAHAVAEPLTCCESSTLHCAITAAVVL